MTYEAEYNALRARFESQWANTTPIAWPNVDFKPTDESPWVRFSIVSTDVRQASFGAATNFYRHPGVIIVQVFTPILQGDKEALQLADQVASIFRNWSDAANRIRFLSPPSVKAIGEDKPWYQVNVSCPYIRDTLF